MRILGVDPGTRLTGYGCIDANRNRIHHVTHGTLRLMGAGEKVSPLEDRLIALYHGLSQVIREVKPQVMVIEKVFFAKNPLSALKLGQARGAVLLTGKIHGLAITEYNPTQVKLAITGFGRADKVQVAKMVGLLTGQREFSTHDASDGLALALCHAQNVQSLSSHPQNAILSQLGTKKRKRFSLAESVGLKKD